MVARLQGETGHSYDELMAMEYGAVLTMNLDVLANANDREEALDQSLDQPDRR